MFKTEFYIRLQTAKKPCFLKVTGWGEVFEAPDKSLIELCFYRCNGCGWRIIEVNTGFAVLGNTFRSRIEAIQACTPDLLERVSKRLKNKYMIEAADTLANYILAAD